MRNVEDIAADQPGRLDSLTGLRFVAAFAVFGLHLLVLHGTPEYGVLGHVFGAGATGVSFFFILSGFVLTWSHHERDTAARFIRRRVARIYPLHVATWIVAGIILTTIATRPHVLPALGSLLLIAPWVNSPHYYGAMNAPSWSLGCEMTFYVLFPLLLPAITRLRVPSRRAALPGLVVFTLFMAWACQPALNGTTPYWLLYTLPLTRLAEFVAGIILAIEVAEGRFPRISLPGAAALSLTAFVGASYVPTAYGFVAVTFVPFMLLIVAAAQADVRGQATVLASRPMVRLGAWSYAFYLVHAEVLYVLSHFDAHTYTVGSAALFGLAALALSIAVAAAAHRFVERPLELALRLPRRLRVQPATSEAPA